MPVGNPRMLCFFCKHFNVELNNRESLFACSAFPDDIPIEIGENEYDHHEPHPDDLGIQFELIDDFELATQRKFFKHLKKLRETENIDIGKVILYQYKRTSSYLYELREVGLAQPPLDDSQDDES